WHGRISFTGMPVRPDFVAVDPAEARRRLGLKSDKPVLLVVGGSQGASGINQLVLSSLDHLRSAGVDLQLLHLAGPREEASVRSALEAAGIEGRVEAFLEDMPAALASADAVICRSGSSFLAELAA